jgi:hypothetical protein
MKKKQLLLPKSRNNDSYVSYSQISSYLSEKSFNLGIDGKLEYIITYFFGRQFPDQGWNLFGSSVEDYICYRNFSKKEIKALDDKIIKGNEQYPDRPNALVSESIASFSEGEKVIMNKIEPLGLYQVEGWIDFKGFKLLLYIDDATKDLKKLRDYKTASENSSKQYYTDSYKQLTIYSLWVKQQTGFYPDELEVCVIERGGNCFGMEDRRDLLFVKDRVWYINRNDDIKKCDEMRTLIQSTAEEISSLYQTYLKLKELTFEI